MDGVYLVVVEEYREVVDVALYHYMLPWTTDVVGNISLKSLAVDISKYIESDYIPVKEKPKSDNKKFDPVTIEGLVLEDDILADFDFFGKICVVSGDSEYRNSVKDKLKSIGAKVVSGMSGSTNALIVSENVGPAKKEKALKLKSDKPDNFHVFTHQSVAKKLGII